MITRLDEAGADFFEQFSLQLQIPSFDIKQCLNALIEKLQGLEAVSLLDVDISHFLFDQNFLSHIFWLFFKLGKTLR